MEIFKTNFKYKILIITLLLILGSQLKAQSDDKIKAIWIFNITQYVSWANEDSISIFKIGIYSSTKSVYNEVNLQTSSKTIKNKPTEAIQIKNLKNVNNLNILFVCNDKIEELDKIYALIQNKNILIISDQASKLDKTMVNILPLNVGTKRFEVNSENLAANNLIASKELLYHGGNENALKNLYAETEKELEKKRTELDAQQTEIQQQKSDLQKQIEENQTQKKDIQKQQATISEQGEQISGQKSELDKLLKNLEFQQEKLRENLTLLENQEGLIAEKQKDVDVKEAEIKAKLQELKFLETEIDSAKTTLNQANEKLVDKDEELNRKNWILIVGAIFIGIIIIFMYLFWRAYRVNLKINKELTTKNIEINYQKNEIVAQSHQLEESNVELEKLSIVASRSQNAITIMDKEGNFEWVNAGFTRMYGYTFQLLINEVDENIKNVSANPNIKTLIESCISNKKNVTYEAENITRDGRKIWVQTTLTPIINDTNDIVRLISIDTEITEIKKAEQEIRLQHKRIADQAKLLEDSNKELEKLSIVASETDNAVLIMDAQGNFEWVNAAYTRMFGYTFEQLSTEISKNLIGEKTDENTKKLINECITKKKTINYQFQAKTKSGNQIWVQTTLTPIVNSSGLITKLIAIDSDITKQKLAEYEIREKNEELEQQKERIELQNRQIRASIGYAQTIQKAILPVKEQMDRNFESFVIFLPKDIVSGDFYWFTEIQNYNFVAAVDCTGHGVPGAFMSLIASRLMNEIINEKNIFEPNIILELINEGVKKALKQDVSDNNDGMDLCMCRLEKLDNQKTQIYFCGAKRPLFYNVSDSNEIITIKGDRKSIGGVRIKKNVVPFSNTILDLKKDDTLYLTTDGFTDQNNPERTKMGTEKFVSTLEKISKLDLYSQKLELERQLFMHMKDAEQRDDITVFGIKLY